MKIYLVGGAVRDQLLGLPVKEKDWVVVGATVDEMLRAGYRQVGKDFPVFLHPKTKEEYALARTERKVGRGYTGFTFDTSPLVTLEEDLKRRDLTINAIAQTETGEIIDPYHGRADLDKKILRHVSSAFAEDPVRILRIARFNARFGFEVASDTLELMRHMVAEGEVNALVAERVWKELERALAEAHPEKFFAVLADSNALPILFPQKLSINALERAVSLSSNQQIRFAALLHLLNQDDINSLCDRYRIPTDYRELAILVVKYLADYQNAKNLTPEALLNLLQMTDAFRRPDRFKHFLTSCAACSSQSNSDWLLACYETAKTVDMSDLVNQYKGQELAQKIKEKRCQLLVNSLSLRRKTKNGE